MNTNNPSKEVVIQKLVEAVDVDEWGNIVLGDVEGFASWWDAQCYALGTVFEEFEV